MIFISDPRAGHPTPSDAGCGRHGLGDAARQCLRDVLDLVTELVGRVGGAAGGAGRAVPGRAHLRWCRQGGLRPDDDDDRRHAPPPTPRPAAPSTPWPPRSTASATRRATAARSRSLRPAPGRRAHRGAAAEAIALGLREGVDAACALRGDHAQRRQQLDVREPHGPCAGRGTTRRCRRSTSSWKDLGLVRSTPRAPASSPCRLFGHGATRCSSRPPPPATAAEDDSAVIKIFPGITLPGAAG